MNVLILEDRVVRAFQLARVIGNAGHTVIGPFSSLDDALHVGEAAKPELAFLSLDHARKDIVPQIAMILNTRSAVHCLYVSNDPFAGDSYRDFALGQITQPDARLLSKTLKVVDCIVEDRPFSEIPAGLSLYHHLPRTAAAFASKQSSRSAW